MQALIPYNPNAQQRAPSGRRPTVGLHWRHYLLVVLEHKWVALISFLTVLAINLIYTYHQTPIYRATAALEVASETMKVLNIQDVLSTDTRDDQYFNTQIKIMQSRTLCEQVVLSLRLDRNPSFLAYAGSQGDLAGALQGRLSVEPERNTTIIDIHVDHPDPKLAADLATGVAQQYIKQNLEKKMLASTDAVRMLSEQADEYKLKVKKSEFALAEYRQRTQSGEERQNSVVDKLKDLNNSVTQAQKARLSAEAEWNGVKALLDAGRSASEIPVIMNNSKVSELRKQLNDKQITLAVLRERYRDQHPSMVAIQTELNEISGKLTGACNDAINALQAGYLMAKANEEILQKALHEQEQESMEMDSKQPDYNMLKRNAEADRQLYDSILTRIKETGVADKLQSNNIRLIDPVQVPGSPFKPQKGRNLAVGLLLGVCAAFAASYLLNTFDDKIKTYEDVDSLGLPLLTGVPHIDLKDASQNGRVLQADPHSISAEAFRNLRASISLKPEANSAKPLLVTSTAPGEGKSVVSANLAIAFATNKQRTLLIDCDLHNPVQHHVFPADPDKGISLYLTSNVTLQEVVQPTNVPNLDVLHVGSIPPNAPELLASDRIRELIADACQQYDRVIIDSPPVTAVSDPLVLLPYVQGVIYVIGFGKTRREIVARTMQRLRECGAPLVGVVMNNIDQELHGYYYYPYKYSYYHKKRKGNGAA
jgi:capsular exopolysaccharide synthesis family protein